jgi:hypothetical protein
VLCAVLCACVSRCAEAEAPTTHDHDGHGHGIDIPSQCIIKYETTHNSIAQPATQRGAQHDEPRTARTRPDALLASFIYFYFLRSSTHAHTAHHDTYTAVQTPPHGHTNDPPPTRTRTRTHTHRHRTTQTTTKHKTKQTHTHGAKYTRTSVMCPMKEKRSRTAALCVLERLLAALAASRPKPHCSTGTGRDLAAWHGVAPSRETCAGETGRGSREHREPHTQCALKQQAQELLRLRSE